MKNKPETTSRGEQLHELCSAVVEAENETIRQGASMLLVAFVYKSTSPELMEACHRFAVKAGYDFTPWADGEHEPIEKDDHIRVSLIERYNDLTTLYLEIVIDADGRHWWVEDMLSNVSTPISETEPGWTTDDIVQHVKLTHAIAKAAA